MQGVPPNISERTKTPASVSKSDNAFCNRPSNPSGDSDPANPKSAAWFESEDGGAHNFWVAGDTLFVGDYQGGMRVLDISGELKGDLGRNGRLMTTITTADAKGHIPNSPSAWGGIYRNGYLYVPDTNSGLWIVQLEPKRSLIP